MASWKGRDGRFRRVSASGCYRNFFVEVCLRDWQSDEKSWDELEERDRVLSSELTEKEVMCYALRG